MDCFLKVIKGPDTGANCKLVPGVNLVGRSNKAALKLSPGDVSWEHISVTRNGEQCVVENLSASGSYLGDARLTGPVRLRSKDVLRLSKDTLIRYESTGGPESSNRGILFLLLLVLCVVAVVVVLVSTDESPAHWNGSYRQIQSWATAQSSFGRLPAETGRLFSNAWRLDQAEDYADSRHAWLKLKMVLDSADAKTGITAKSAEHPQALASLLQPDPNKQTSPDDDEMAAALIQFVNRRLTYSTAQAQAK